MTMAQIRMLVLKPFSWTAGAMRQATISASMRSVSRVDLIWRGFVTAAPTQVNGQEDEPGVEMTMH